MRRLTTFRNFTLFAYIPPFLKEIVYLGSAIANRNDVSLESNIKFLLPKYFITVSVANWEVENSLVLINAIQLAITPCKAWTLLRSNAAALGVYERKIPGKIFDTVCVGDYAGSTTLFRRKRIFQWNELFMFRLADIVIDLSK